MCGFVDRPADDAGERRRPGCTVRKRRCDGNVLGATPPRWHCRRTRVVKSTEYSQLGETGRGLASRSPAIRAVVQPIPRKNRMLFAIR